MKPFRWYFLGTLGIFLFAFVYTGNLTITVFEMIIQSLGSIKFLFLQFYKPLFYWWFFSRGEQRRRKRFWPAVLHLTTLRGQARRFLSLSRINENENKNKQEKILAFLTPDHFIIANINLMYCSCLVTVLRRHGGNPHLVENLYSLQSIMVQMGRLIFVHSFPSISPAFNHRARKLPSKKSIAQHRTVGSVFHIGNCRCRLSEGSAAFVW